VSLLDQLKAANPALADYSDEEILGAAHKTMGGDLGAVASRLGYDAPSSMMGKELYAGGNRYLGGFGHIGGALGIPGAAEYAQRKEARAQALQGMSTAPHSWEEMKLGDPEKGFWPYAGQLAAGSAPYAAEALGYTAADIATGGALTPAIIAKYAAQAGAAAPRILGGQALREGADFATRRAAVTAAQEAAPGLARTAMLPAVTYPSALGDTLGNQFEESGRYNLPTAAAAAVPYSALNVLGVEGAITRGALPRLGIKGLEKTAYGRAASGALASGTSEAIGETGQEVANQAARMGVNPNAGLFDPAALERYKESAIGGGILGGLPGTLHAMPQRKPLDRNVPADLTKRLPQETYEQQIERAYGMAPGDLGLRTPEEQSKFTQAQAERDLNERLYPGAAPTAPTYSADAIGEMERAANVPPGTFSASPAAAVPPGGPKAKATANAARDANAAPVDPVIQQIQDTKTQIAAAHAVVFPEDQAKKPHLIRQEITRWVGDPKTIDEAVATLRTKIAAVLEPGQGKGSKAERAVRAERMIQLHDELLGVPEAQRLPLDAWESHFATQRANAAAAAAAAKAKVGEAGKLPGAAVSIDPATLNTPPGAVTPPTSTPITPATAAPTAPVPTAPTPLPPKPTNPAEIEAYRAAIIPHLVSGVAPEELEALQLIHGLKAENAGDEEAVVASLRAAAKESGIPHTTLADRAARAIAQITENAAKADLPVEAAQALLGMQTSLDVADIAMPTGAYEGQQRVNMAPSDDFSETETDAYEPDLGNEQREVAAPPAAGEDAALARAGEEVGAETAVEGEEADAAVEAKAPAKFASGWNEELQNNVAEASEEWEDGRQDDDPTWDQLPNSFQLQWVKGYVSAHAAFPKSKEAPQLMKRLGVARTKVKEGLQEQEDADSEAETGVGDAGAAGGSGPEVGGVSEPVSPEDQGGVSPAAERAGPAEDAQGEARAEPEKPTEAKGTGADVKEKQEKAAAEAKVAPGKDAPVATKKKRTVTKTLETEKVETSAERAERKWNEAAAVVPVLGKWSDLSKAGQDKFTTAAEQDQKIADAVKVKEADKTAPKEEKQEAAAPKEEKQEAPPPPKKAKWESQHVTDARALLATVDAGGTPLSITSNLRRIAEGFGMEVSKVAPNNADTAAALVDRIRKAVARVDSVGDIQRSEKTPREQDKATGTTRKGATTVEHAVDKLKKLFFSTKRFDQRVTVVQSVSDLDPAFVKKNKIGAHTQAYVHEEGGKPKHVYLIADNIDKGSELGIFLHEMGAHVGMENLIGKQAMANLSKQVLKWAEANDGSQKSTLALAAIARVDAAAKLAEERGQPFEMRDYMEETIAYFIEEAVAQGINPTAADATTELGRWFRKLWAAAKVALRKMGLERFDSLTAKDIVNLAYGAARLELEGNWHGTAAIYRKFNHDYMSSGEGTQAFAWGSYLAQRMGIGKGYWEDDVRRKSGKANTRVIPGYWKKEYDGQSVGDERPTFDVKQGADPAATAKYDMVMLSGDNPVAKLRSGPEFYQREIESEQRMRAIWNGKEPTEQEKFYEQALVEYAKLDPKKATYKYVPSRTEVVPASKGNKIEGALLRVDVNAEDHELLDWDKPLAEQPPLVQKALRALNGEEGEVEAQVTIDQVNAEYEKELFRHTDLDQAMRIGAVVRDWYADGGKDRLQDLAKDKLSPADNRVYLSMRDRMIKKLFTVTPIHPESSAGKIYLALAARMGGKKAVSLALDKLGVKGVKFFDAQSRDKDKAHEGPARLVAPKLLGTKLESGYRIDSSSYIRMDERGDLWVASSRGSELFSEHNHQPHPDHAAIVDKLKRDFSPAAVDRARTRNLVIFNEKNLFRVFSRIGAKEDKVRFSERAPTTGTPTASAQHVTNLKAHAQKFGLGAMITEDIADAATAAGLPEVRGYVEASKAREADRARFEKPVEKIADQYELLPQNERGTGEGSVNKFIHDATRAGNTDGIERFSASGQDLIKAVFKHGAATLAMKKDLIAAEVNKAYDERIAEETDPAEKAKLEKERKAAQARFSSLMKVKNSDTYAPLKRFGDYVVSAKSAEYLAAEAGKTDADRKWIAENQSDPNHYQVHFADSQGEADTIEADLKPTFAGGKTYAAARTAAEHGHRDLFRAFPVLQTRLAREHPTEGVSPMARIIRDLYLQALSESSARKSEMKRRDITGASTDMVRAFVTQGRADAAFMSSLKHNDTVLEALEATREGAERDRRKLTPYLNEMLLRHAASYETQASGVLGKMRRATSLWMLATNPAYYLQQLVQPWSMSLPVIAGTHGYFRTVRALQQGYKDVVPLVRGTTVGQHIDWSKAPDDVRAMLDTVSHNGAIDVSNAMDMGEWATAGKSTAGKVWNKIDKKLRGLNTHVESLNRAATAIAAYRMELARNGGDRAAATAYAEAMVRQTHGSYDASNTPRYMQSSGAKVLTQFRRFQIIQISMVARMAYNAFKGDTPLERGIARRALTYTLLHTGAIGGALGMPGAALVTSLVARLFGPDDEPPDFEKLAREAIGDQMIADLLLKGVPAMLGVDVSSKFGMGQMLSVAPFAEVPKDREGFEKYMFAVLGPSVGLGAKAVDGLSLIYKGDIAKGSEQLLPSGVGNVVKAGRIATEGVTTRAGDTTLSPEELGLVDALFQGAGLPTSPITTQQRLSRTKFEFDTYYKDRTSELIHDYQQARKAGEPTTDVIAEWNEVQAARVRNGYARQPLSTLIKSAQAQRKRERDTAGGVEFTKANKQFVRNQANL
jgi:hypothetical protein